MTEEDFFELLNGDYKHYCSDWDFMAIDETFLEFECCTCYDPHVYEETRHLRAKALEEVESSSSM